MTTPRDLQRRLAAIEEQIATEHSPPVETELDEREWLDHYAAEPFVDEPEYAAALDAFRRELTAAEQRSDWHPPPDFRPYSMDRPKLRAQFWRDPRRFTQLHEAHSWVMQVWAMRVRGIPAYSVQEFADLRQWFEAHSGRINELARPSGLIDLGDGHRLNPTNVRYGLLQGPCDFHAAETVVTTRMLQAMVEAKEMEASHA